MAIKAISFTIPKNNEIYKMIICRNNEKNINFNRKKSAKYVRYVKESLPNIYEHYKKKHFEEFGELV